MQRHHEIASGRRGRPALRFGWARRLAPLAFALAAAALQTACERPQQSTPAPMERPAPQAEAAPATLDAPYYSTGPQSYDGIGKYYMGREISHVMGHLGAGWLERPEREREEKPQLLVDNMGLEPDDTVADIGAGTGYFSFRIARIVTAGKVLAVDIQPEMLEMISEKASKSGLRNVVPIRGEVDDPKLPAGEVDAALLVDAYHEFSQPREMMEGLFRGLRSGGRVFLIEYRAEDPRIPIKRLHKMSQDQAKKEMAAVGLEWIETKDILPQQHMMIFAKP